ncbi:amidohydrolase [Arsenicicoccus sp. oral taxon 190]|uniref:amidohydrolase n=1 Tax=Arsenicicoccus sp. oral taxon 190 TaxID=1658671 RepID=UPI000679FCDE|nr:amidohydrolase [Arsenicicoccus sp. oral taxon 190]AKT51663.1 amidohydrolase [Arsenicicoccus sp. oral taxon 190]
MTRTLWVDADLRTLDPAHPVATALLTEGEHVLAVGTADELRAHTTGITSTIGLGGATVTPGLVDAHIHTAGYARDLTTVDLRACATQRDALATIARFVAGLEPGRWVFGGRWDANDWPEGLPGRDALDRVCPDRPAVLPSIDGHTHWVNSLALQHLSINDHTPDPPGGTIERDAHGRATGILRESATLGGEHLMTLHSGDLTQQLRVAQQRLLAVGLTGVHCFDGEDARAAYESLRAAGELALRVHKSVPLEALDRAIGEGRRTGDGDAWLSTGPVKVFSDGALGSHTCHMGEPFPDGGHGIEVVGVPELVDVVVRATRAGISVATHAIGDEANHRVLTAYAEARRLAGPPALRHRIEHTQHLRPDDVARLAALDVVASMQPTHCTSDIRLVERLLAGRDLRSYAWASLLRAGALVVLGSDAPVEEPDPMAGIQAAVTRQELETGYPPGGFEPRERLAVDQAVHGFTVAPARAAGRPAGTGMLRPGAVADLVAWSGDPWQLPPAELGVVRALTTVVGGTVRHTTA